MDAAGRVHYVVKRSLEANELQFVTLDDEVLMAPR